MRRDPSAGGGGAFDGPAGDSIGDEFNESVVDQNSGARSDVTCQELVADRDLRNRGARERLHAKLPPGSGQHRREANRLAGPHFDPLIRQLTDTNPGALQILDDGHRRTSALRGLTNGRDG